jgi:low molecular weight protein-tyrosine phosphatase
MALRPEPAGLTGPIILESMLMAVEGAFSILCVCTGNICRSPTAERLLRDQLLRVLGRDAASFRVASAGTRAIVGEPMQEHAASLLRDRGVDPDGFRARQLSERLVLSADLVLAMTREHRAEIAMVVPDVVPRLFTMCEFARLATAAAAEIDLGQPAVDRAFALVPAASARRGSVIAARPSEDDVGDPFGGPASGYLRPFEVIDGAAGAIVAIIAGQTRVPPN